jgi:hypothetical protein
MCVQHVCIIFHYSDIIIDKIMVYTSILFFHSILPSVSYKYYSEMDSKNSLKCQDIVVESLNMVWYSLWYSVCILIVIILFVYIHIM